MAKPSQARHSSLERMPAPGDGLALRELLAILQRRRRVIIWVTAMVTTVAVLMGLQVTRTYTATAQVMLEPRESRIIEAETVAPGLPAEDNAIIDTHIRLIQSHASLARAVDNLDLASEPRFVPGQSARESLVAAPVALLAAWLPDWLADQLPVRWALAAGIATDGAPGFDPETLREQAIDMLRGGVRVTQSGQSYVLWISYVSSSPDRPPASPTASPRPTSTCSSTRSSRLPVAPAPGSPSRSSSCAGACSARSLRSRSSAPPRVWSTRTRRASNRSSSP
jgi:uncharacterized protein involved in exopolysaccharide biosynthesis